MSFMKLITKLLALGAMIIVVVSQYQTVNTLGSINDLRAIALQDASADSTQLRLIELELRYISSINAQIAIVLSMLAIVILLYILMKND